MAPPTRWCPASCGSAAMRNLASILFTAGLAFLLLIIAVQL